MQVEIIISDTSCLIDLRKSSLLYIALHLPYRFAVALPLIESELHDFSIFEWRELERRGLRIIDLDAEEMLCAKAMRSKYPGISDNDAYSLALSKSLDNSMLLTGDQSLRNSAVREDVDVHGILWITDQLEEKRAIPLSQLLHGLKRLADDPLVFLPPEEVHARIARLMRRRGH